MKNGEGYNDPTAGAAIGHIERERKMKSKSADKLNRMIRQLADFCGFEIVGKLEFKDKATGQIFKSDNKW